jgi:protein TonB
MSQAVPHTGSGVRIGEICLWAMAGLLVLTVHIAAAALLLREDPAAPPETGPPAAIMIELAPEPVAAKTEEEQISPDVADAEEVKSEELKPVEEPQPEPVEQPQPEPTREPVAEQPPEPVEPPPQEVAEAPEPAPPEPVVEQPPVETPPEPAPEITQTIPEPPPEPIEPIDPIEEQVTAALDNVEVPLPMMRPLPPAVEKPPEASKKVEPKKQPVKKVEKPKQQQQQAQKEMAQAKLQTTQSNRTAASQNSAGFFSSSVSPAQWMTRVRAKIARNARKCPGGGTGTAAIRFSFDGSGNITNVSVSQSSGDPAIDSYIAAAVRRASPIPAPPSGVASSLNQPLRCE